MAVRDWQPSAIGVSMLTASALHGTCRFDTSTLLDCSLLLGLLQVSSDIGRGQRMFAAWELEPRPRVVLAMGPSLL